MNHQPTAGLDATKELPLNHQLSSLNPVLPPLIKMDETVRKKIDAQFNK